MKFKNLWSYVNEVKYMAYFKERIKERISLNTLDIITEEDSPLSTVDSKALLEIKKTVIEKIKEKIESLNHKILKEDDIYQYAIPLALPKIYINGKLDEKWYFLLKSYEDHKGKNKKEERGVFWWGIMYNNAFITLMVFDREVTDDYIEKLMEEHYEKSPRWKELVHNNVLKGFKADREVYKDYEIDLYFNRDGELENEEESKKQFKPSEIGKDSELVLSSGTKIKTWSNKAEDYVEREISYVDTTDLDKGVGNFIKVKVIYKEGGEHRTGVVIIKENDLIKVKRDRTWYFARIQSGKKFLTMKKIEGKIKPVIKYILKKDEKD